MCISVYVSVQAIPFEPDDRQTSFLVWWYIWCGEYLGQVWMSKSRSSHGKFWFCYLDISLAWFDFSEVKVINEVRVIVRSRSFQGHIASVWVSIGNREVGLWLKGILVSENAIKGNKYEQEFCKQINRNESVMIDTVMNLSNKPLNWRQIEGLCRFHLTNMWLY